MAQGAVEFGAPVGRVGTGVRPREVALVKVRGRRIPMGFEPSIQLAPSTGEPLISPMVEDPGHLHRRPGARLDPACGHYRRRDRDTELKVKNVGLDLEVMGEPGPGRGNALSGDGCPQLRQTGLHDLLDGLSRDGEPDEGGQFWGGLNDFGGVEHKGSVLPIDQGLC